MRNPTNAARTTVAAIAIQAGDAHFRVGNVITVTLPVSTSGSSGTFSSGTFKRKRTTDHLLERKHFAAVRLAGRAFAQVPGATVK